MPTDLGGNTLNTATNLNLSASLQTFRDSISLLDPNDFYKFSLSGRSSFSASLNGLSADADLELIRDFNNNGFVDSGEVIAFSEIPGSSPESINATLGAGNYYIRAYSFDGNPTNYNLNVSATLVDYAGNTLSTARNVGTLSNTQQVFRDAVTGIDPNDYYRFTVDPTSQISIQLNGLSADADLQLLNSSGQVVRNSINSGTAAESINTNGLAAGVYYVRVYQFGGNTNYNLTLSATPPDFAGNALTTARNMGALNGTRTLQDWVGNADSSDYYRFNIGPNSNLSLRLDGLSADADLQLLNISGQVIASSLNDGTAADVINVNNLAAGAYFVRVNSFSGSGFYNLTMSATVPDFAGNNLGTARNLGWLNGSRSIQDWVGSGVDGNDFYSFSLNSNSNFSLSLNGLSADADVRLLNSSGQLIASSLQLGTTPEALNGTLAAGTYYVQVNSFGNGNTYYNLNLSATLNPAIDYAGNTLLAARDIGTLSNTQQVFRERVSSIDTNDYYRFTVDPTSQISIQLNGLSADADLQLLNSSGQVVASSINDGTLAESINTQGLAPGVYYVRVYQFSGNTNYNLSISATPPDFAGNALTTARNMGPLNGTRTVQDWVGNADFNDSYRFNVGPNSNLSLRLDGLSADADLQLLNSSGQVIASSLNDGTLAEVININNLAAGAYFVRVNSFSGSGFYNLTMSATVPDFAGNTLATARSLGQLNGSRTIQDWVGSGIDPNDFYSFQLSDTRNIGLSLNGLSANADIQLLNSSGQLIASSAQIGSTPESLTRTLAAGTYYVRVNSLVNSNSYYNLSLLA